MIIDHQYKCFQVNYYIWIRFYFFIYGVLATDELSKNWHFAISGKDWSLLRQHFPLRVPYIVQRGTVFARMSPDQKAQLIEELKKNRLSSCYVWWWSKWLWCITNSKCWSIIIRLRSICCRALYCLMRRHQVTHFNFNEWSRAKKFQELLWLRNHRILSPISEP